MREKSKVNSGLKSELKSVKYGRDFSIFERKKIVEDYLSSGNSKQAIWEKYTGQCTEHGIILRWMRDYGYCKEAPKTIINRRKISTFAKTTASMETNKEELEFEIQVLQKRVKELERQAEESELKAVAFSTMIDIAEKTFNIPVRKKFNTKP
jgi:hypothetical protein